VHELGIVFHIADTLEQVAKENRIHALSSVTLEIGEV
jgi:hydrogenase nickel incorporation protein HypA/HybF